MIYLNRIFNFVYISHFPCYYANAQKLKREPLQKNKIYNCVANMPESFEVVIIACRSGGEMRYRKLRNLS